MKKVLVLCLTVILMMSMCVTAFAADGGFVSSPSAKQAPTVIKFECEEDCEATLTITPYGEKSELPADLKALIEKAYGEIKASNNLTELCAALKKLATAKKIKGTDLVVTELFDIRVEGCTIHENHHELDIVINPDTLKNFVGLLHMKKNGEWELIEDAKVVANGDHLAFSVDTLSPFAIVVNTGANPSQTGDYSMIAVYVAVMAISAGAIILIIAKTKKQKA